jgi:serine/threonine protein kinase
LWKLADFGSAAYTASKSRVTTHERRGTDSYRAPEVIQSGYFNNRSDIFALGCIVFEVVIGRALFTSDWAINTYAEKNESIFPDHWPTSQSGSILYRLGQLSAEMLSAAPSERPGAATVLDRLQSIRNGDRSVDPSLLADDEIFPPMDETTEAGILFRNPTVQTSYSQDPFPSNSIQAAEHPLDSYFETRMLPLPLPNLFISYLVSECVVRSLSEVASPMALPQPPIAEHLRPHVWAKSLYQYPLFPDLSVQSIADFLQNAISLASAMPFRWDFIDCPAPGSLIFVWMASQTFFMPPTDGYQYLDPEIPIHYNVGNDKVE